MSNHYSQKDNLITIMTEISKKTPRGIMNSDVQVGHITWQMYLMRDYLKLDGTPLANASNDYSDLLSFAQDNNLITNDTTDNSLFKYNSTTDVLTLPNYIDLVLQGGNSVEEKEAGLPNIKGDVIFRRLVVHTSSDCFSDEIYSESMSSMAEGGTREAIKVDFDASKSNSIYSDSVNTVQPPAITLIPQIKYRKATTMYEQIEAVVNYSTTEKVIGTWIDGKPLYQITAEFTTPSATGVQQYSFLPTVPFATMDKLIDINGWCARSDGWRVPFNQVGIISNTSVILFFADWNKTDSQIYLSVYSGLTNNQPATLTFQYTKTTD